MTLLLTTVLAHTPGWVWALLALLVALGWRQSRPHRVTPVRLALQPLALGAWSLAAALAAFLPALGAGALLGWGCGAAMGALANRRLGLPRVVSALPDGAFLIGGSWAPMALLMSVFAIRYAVSASIAVVPELATLPAFAAAACTLYGLPAGLFAARALHVLAARARGGAPGVA